MRFPYGIQTKVLYRRPKARIAHAVKIVLVPVVLLRPYGSVYYWLFSIFRECKFPIGEDDFGSQVAVDSRRMPQSTSLIFLPKCRKRL